MKNSVWPVISIVFLVFALSSCSNPFAGNAVFETYRVLKVVDGDTIDVLYNGQSKSVRYIGIDTPETHNNSKPVGKYGTDAAEFNAKMISEASSDVKLEFDGDSEDRYGRLLAYIWVDSGASEVMLNSSIIKNGLAWPLTYSDTSKHTAEFWKDYRYAYEHRLGLFSEYDTAPTVQASVVDADLGYYVGKPTWVQFGPVDYTESSYDVTLSSEFFTVNIRLPELGEFAAPVSGYAGKILRVYGEVWKQDGKGYMLLHAPFEIESLQ